MRYAATEDYRDLARAMGWDMSITANVTLTKRGCRTIVVHYGSDISIVRALIQAAEVDQGVRL